MSLRWLLCTLKARHCIKALFPSSQPTAWDALYLFQLKTCFLPPLFLLFLWRTMSLSVLVPFPQGVIIIICQLYPPPSHPIFLCLNLQDPADSGALTRPHLHGRRVFQRGANRLWQRPEVSKTVQYNRPSTSRCTANGLENNGCALLMVFIIAIKLLLPYSIGRDIMQNENKSIHYWFDVNCVMEISLCAVEESVTRQHCI